MAIARPLLSNLSTGVSSVIRIATLAWLLCLTAFLPVGRSAEFYVDPVHGDANNDGSAQKAWKSLQAVVDKGLVESRQWEKLPYKDGASLAPRNSGAPVKAGDTIYLRSGDYGELEIRG